ncbi:UDP-N-acetylmuramoyl-tripeptide--D-alanyl-D-alanine ligase [Desulfotruncus alcoholivorax]|uniref:UDP-N-acetylmuramoyl-tripeptide--D-alanyl-D- alanine ligase n=1 Tax=Desulfotruncus alcoholivorax TaxID=265477 RepID=UPI00041F836A|nr:UDP-N-acetylmuramoyl-tripeptide--D-alanyl-D-alanine ligase [Desulfotruncus alcoholivorax]
MKTMTVGQIYRAIGGRLLQGDESITLSRVCTDTRQIQKGDLFFALLGEKFDAHDFIDQAINGGAGALVISRKVTVPEGVPVIQVRDTLVGLQELAAYNRRQFNVPVVGITGSSGKTTTKDMVAAILGTRYKVLKTKGNFNNEIGLPLTLLDFSDQHDVAVVEMAMRGPGEIDSLCRLARPTCAIINNIGVAHLERLGSEANIARAKGEILDHISPTGFALLPGDSEPAREQASRCYGKVLYFGFDQNFDIYAEDIHPEAGGNRFTAVMGNNRCNIFLPLPGLHNVMNALAAVGTGLLLGLTPGEIEKGLAGVALSGMRTEIINQAGYTIVNDAYNANPDSAVAALQALEELAGDRRKVAVLGDMLELGTGAVAGHLRVGAAAVRHGVKLLVTVGELAEQIAEGALQAGKNTAMQIFSCAEKPEALKVLRRELRSGDMVLVKGSRGMRMEEIVKDLLKD